MNVLRTLAVGLVVTALGVSVGGCSGGSARYNVEVAPDQALRTDAAPPTIAVDMIAVTEEEAASWRAMPISRYWSPDSPIRRGKMNAIKSLTFAPGGMSAQTLRRDDPIWDSWKGANTLFVLARLPGVDDQAGEMDPRRVSLPLDRSRWDEDTLRVTLKRTGLVRESQPKPEQRR